MSRSALLFASAILLAAASPSHAGDDTQLSPWQIRIRATSILPDEDATIRPVSGSADIEEVIIPELDISYFFTPHIAAELVLLISSHDVDARLSGVGNVDLGEVNLLPPTLLLQYHFRPDAKFRPYAGAG
ncbi:MAG: OmpW/AlkL family protein, partial [Pseudomonadota bacterium]